MSGFRVDQPVFQETLKCYRIPVTGPHDYFTKVATMDTLQLDPLLDCSGTFMEFIHDFLTQANPFFSKSLPAPIFLQRLIHSWDRGDWTEEDLTFTGRARISWVPSCVDFYSHSYTLHWTLMDVEVLEDEDTPPTPPVQPLAEPIAEPMPSSAAPTAPFPEEQIPFTSPHKERERMKQKVRRARLRAAIAHLRAEKMAENYYMRYGFQEEEDDSDSDLTYASETESGKI